MKPELTAILDQLSALQLQARNARDTAAPEHRPRLRSLALRIEAALVHVGTPLERAE